MDSIESRFMLVTYLQRLKKIQNGRKSRKTTYSLYNSMCVKLLMCLAKCYNYIFLQKSYIVYY